MKKICNICQGTRFKLIKAILRDEKSKFKVFRCQKCSHYQILPRPTPKEDRDFYYKNLQDKHRNKKLDYNLLKNNARADTSRQMDFVTRFCNKASRILDIGAGYGFFIDALYKRGYKNVIGVEIGGERRQIAIQHTSAPIIKFDIAEPDQNIGKFDIITLFHVLEHMADPVAFLKNVRSFLKHNGLFICEVPNVNELLLENSAPYNDFYWIRAHLNYFSRSALRDMLKQSGFKSVKIEFVQRYGLLNLSNWLLNGKPQIEKPVFSINQDYEQVENYYKEHLKQIGRTDTIVAVCR